MAATIVSQRSSAAPVARHGLARAVFIWTARLFLIVALVIVSAVLALYFLDWNTMRGPVSRYLSHRLEREVRITGNLRVNLFSWQPRVDLGGLWIANPEWLNSRPAADVRHLTFEFRLLPLLFGGRWVLPLVSLDHPSIDIVREADGRTNWQFTNNSQGADIPPIRRFLLNEGSVHIEDHARRLTFSGTVSSRENEGTTKAAFQLFGTGTLNGKTFNADVRGGPLIHVDISRPYAFNADVRAGATHAVIAGQITKPFQLGHYIARATVTGSNLSDLYDLTSVALPGTPPYRISGTLVRDGALYRLTSFTGTVGHSDLHGNVSVDTSGKLPFLRGAVASTTLNFSDLGPVVGQSATGDSTKSILPDTPLRVGRLRGTNAEVDYTANSITSHDFPLRKLSTHISLENGVLQLKPLAFEFARGRLAGSVRIDARRPTTVTSMDARLSHVHIEQFIKNAEKPLSGIVEARAVLSGEGNSVRTAAQSANGALTLVIPEGRVRRSLAEWLGVNVISALGLTLSGDTSNADLRCALVHFQARRGVFAAQQMVFDTDPVFVSGTGDIDLRDETLNLTVEGKPKHFQLLHLNVPVTVQGSLAHPIIGVKSGHAIAQAGIAAALGFLFPPAAILPFVDAGLAKNANCAALVAQAGTKSAPVKVRTPHR
ncbi:MAG TPA: AsmA family protein [Rhizomicrobium sp.]|nr:AsmA family protein [Rhizomicrobium sp.]